MANFFIYPTPLNAVCTLQHDFGWTLTGTSAVDANGRPGQIFGPIPSETPDGWGARLTITADKKVPINIRGFFRFGASAWYLFADDFSLTDEKVCPEVPIPPNPIPPSNDIPDDPFGIIKWTYNHQGPFDLKTKEGCGKFTESCCKNLHEYHQSSWGHIRKIPPQNQYNGHAVDAVQLLLDDLDGTKSGIYDIILSSESSDAKPAFNRAGDARTDLWYYPA